MKFSYFLVSLTIFGINIVLADTRTNRVLNIFDVSVHVIDTNKGKPVSDVPVSLYKFNNNDHWVLISKG